MAISNANDRVSITSAWSVSKLTRPIKCSSAPFICLQLTRALKIIAAKELEAQ